MYNTKLLFFVAFVVTPWTAGDCNERGGLHNRRRRQGSVWVIPAINGDDPALVPPRTFTVVLGPNGGANGYAGITGNSNSFLPLAWYVNQELAPVIMMTRGNTYTFNIHNSATHPFIITDDSQGGRRSTVPSGLHIFAGLDASGAPTSSAIGSLWIYKPANGSNVAATSPDFATFFQTLTLDMSAGTQTGVLTFTPDSSIPDTVFYQCNAHSFFGWKILISDSTTAGTAMTSTATKRTTAMGPMTTHMNPGPTTKRIYYFGHGAHTTPSLFVHILGTLASILLAIRLQM